MDGALDRLIESGGEFALLFIDLDNFKTVNDTQGHLTGDTVLRSFASLLRSTARETDFVCRYGGDEFVVLLPVTCDSDAEALAERIAAAARERLGREWGVTASIGVAFFPEDAGTKNDLISLADQAMYTAKNSGRSRWCRSHAVTSDLHWSSDVFVGRRSELERLSILLPSPGNTVLAMVRGETGMGKSALLSEAVRRAGLSARVMKVACRKEFRSIPFAPLIGAVRRTSAFMGVPELPRQWAKVLGTVLPDVFGEKGEVEGALERVALMEALLALLRAWSPVVLLLEDAHWMDPGTAEFVSYLMQFGEGCSVTLLCAARTEPEVLEGGSLATGLAGLEGCVTIDLAPFGRPEVVELARACLGATGISPELADRLFRVSGGLPIFAVEYLRSLFESGALRLDRMVGLAREISPSTPSQKVRDLISSKLAAMKTQERQLLVVAAAAGELVDPELVARVSGLSNGEVITALDRAAHAGILEQVAPLSFGFRNLLYREEIARWANPHLVRRVNLALAEHYRSAGNHHRAALCFEICGETVAAVDEWMAAGADAFCRKLSEEAVIHYERACELAKGLSGDPEMDRRLLEIYDEIQRGHLRTGQLMKSREASLRAAALAGSLGLSDRRAELLSRAADMLRVAGDPGGALAELKALEGEADGPILMRILLRGLDSASRTGDTAEAERILARATKLRKRLGPSDKDIDSSFYHKLVLHYLCRLDLDRAWIAARKALSAPHSADSEWFLQNDLGEVCMLSGRIPRGIRCFTLARRAAEDLPTVWGTCWTSINLGYALYQALRFRSASEELNRSQVLCDRITDKPAEACILMIRARMLLDTDFVDEAGEMFERAFAVSAQTSRDYFRSLVLSARHRYKEALEAAEAAVRAAEFPGRTLQLESGTLLTARDCHVQLHRARIEANVPGAMESLEGLIPSLSGRSRLRASRILASSLASKGRTEEADACLRVALGDPAARHETLELFLLYQAWSAWNAEAAEKAAGLGKLLSR